jgi:hypothetical protein
VNEVFARSGAGTTSKGRVESGKRKAESGRRKAEGGRHRRTITSRLIAFDLAFGGPA